MSSPQPREIIVSLVVIMSLNLNMVAYSSKILIPGSLMRGRGHTTILSALCAELTSRGHEVTILVPSDDHLKIGAKFANSNATEILEYKTVPVPESDFVKSFRAGNVSNTAAYETWLIVTEVVAEQVSYCRQLLRNDHVMITLKASNYNLVIVDMGNGCDALLPEAMKVPFVALTSNTQVPLMSYLSYGFPLELSYVISPILNHTKDHSFPLLLRVKNILASYIMPLLIIRRKFATPFTALQEELNISPDEDVLTLAQKAQFWLAHDSYMLEAPHPSMPNWRQIGGMAAARTHPLPPDFAEFADGAGEKGFIVFSSGSIVANFDHELSSNVASVLKRLPQRVFWKHTGEPPGLGNNTMVSSWLPQNDLLAHPKARLFIGHGGLNGIYEALYHGVPMLLMPQMLADQTLNAMRVENCGYGLHLAKKDYSAELLERRISQILNDASFSENVRRCSLILQDDDPMDRGVYWIEHVLKFGGGYLRAEVFNLNFVQYYLLDVLALLLFVIFISALSVYYSCLGCCSVVRRHATVSYPVKNAKAD